MAAVLDLPRADPHPVLTAAGWTTWSAFEPGGVRPSARIAPGSTGTIAVITDNLFSHSSLATRDWLAGHPRLEQVFIPKGACWLNLQEAWWRIFRRHALAGQTFVDPGEIAQVTGLATAKLNARAKPWVWGRPPPPPRLRRRRFTYLLRGTQH